MTFRLEFAADTQRDFEAIFDFLIESCREFGDDPEQAFERAAERIQSIRASAETLAATPYIGTCHDDLLSGLRHVTIERSILWFEIDDTSKCVRILAVFFGGQDHQRRMLIRLLSHFNGN